MGWVGGGEAIEPLSKILLKDPVPINRGWAATALRQLWFANKALASKILPYLKEAVFLEKNEQALKLVIISLQSILNKKFGLVEDIDRREIKGYTEKAKKKVLEYFK